MNRFYMCLAENGSHPPTVRHGSIDLASKEAERLTRAPGGKVHVLASVATVEKTDVRRDRHEPPTDEDDIPF